MLAKTNTHTASGSSGLPSLCAAKGQPASVDERRAGHKAVSTSVQWTAACQLPLCAHALFTKHTIKKDCLLAVTGKDNTLFNIWLQQILFCFSKKKKKKSVSACLQELLPEECHFLKRSWWMKHLLLICMATYFGRSLWPRTLDDLYDHVLWTVFMTTYFGRRNNKLPSDKNPQLLKVYSFKLFLLKHLTQEWLLAFQ